METLNSWRPALFGSSRVILTLGLMMARRDLRLQGICPDIADQVTVCAGTVSDTAIAEAESRALHGTLLLGCPVCGDAAELLERSDLLLADSDISRQLTDMTDRPVVTVSESAAAAEENPAETEFAVSVADNGRPRTLRFSCSDVRTLSDMRRLWECLLPSKSWDSDAGLLDWEQAGALAERLFAENLTA